MAKIAGDIVGPDNHLAAIAIGGGIGAEGRVLCDKGTRRIAHIRILALVIAADENLAAARSAARADRGVVEKPDAFAGDPHRTAVARAVVDVDRGITVDDGILLRGEDHTPVGIDAGAGGADVAGVFECAGEQARRIAGFDDAEVQHRIGRRLQGKLHTLGIGTGNGQRLPGCQHHAAVVASDQSGVFDLRADQEYVAAGADRTLVAQHAVAAAVELQAPGEEIGVADVEGGGDESRGVDGGAGAEHDAVRVDQEYAAVRGQRTEDARRIAPGDTVQHRAQGGLLLESGEFAGADIERLPVEDGARGVGDGQRLADAVEGGGTGGDLGADRVGPEAAAECQQHSQCNRTQHQQHLFLFDYFNTRHRCPLPIQACARDLSGEPDCDKPPRLRRIMRKKRRNSQVLLCPVSTKKTGSSNPATADSNSRSPLWQRGWREIR